MQRGALTGDFPEQIGGEGGHFCDVVKSSLPSLGNFAVGVASKFAWISASGLARARGWIIECPTRTDGMTTQPAPH